MKPTDRLIECPVCGHDRCYRNWCFRHRVKIYWQKDGTCNYGYYVNGEKGIRVRKWSAKSEQKPPVSGQSSIERQSVMFNDEHHDPA